MPKAISSAGLERLIIARLNQDPQTTGVTAIGIHKMQPNQGLQWTVSTINYGSADSQSAVDACLSEILPVLQTEYVVVDD